MLNNAQSKKESENVVEQKVLIKLNPDELENFPSIEIKYNVYPSNFGVHELYGSLSEKKVLKNGNIIISSHDHKLLSLKNIY